MATPETQQPLSTLGPNLIRTYVPVLVGTLVSWLISWHVQIDNTTKAGLIALMTSALTAGYYTVVRVVEERYPSVGLLLGARQPAVVQAAEHEYDQLAPEPEDAGLTLLQPAAPPPPPPSPSGPRSNLARLVADTPPPEKRRGPATGAIPTYKPPPGR